MAEGALAGFKVLDLTEGVSGPFCTKLLADQGAEIIKIERPRVGDWSRHRGPFAGDRPGPERSLLFAYLNTNKLSVTLDLDGAFGQEAVRRLAKDADILVEAFQPGYLDERGLSVESLRKANPKLVVSSVPLFPRNGPYAQWKAADINMYAMSGLMSLVGAIGKPPLKAGGYQSLYMAGLQTFAFTLFATYRARATGKGCWIDTSVLQTCGKITTQQPREGGVPVGKAAREADRERSNGVLPCREGYVNVTLYYHLLPALADFLGDPAIAKDPTFATPGLASTQKGLRPLVAKRLKSMTADEAMIEGQKRHLLFTKVNTTRDLLDSPHFAARGSFVKVESEDIGSARLPGPPFRLTGSPPPPPKAAPRLGESNEQVLRGRLGYSRDEIARLYAAGAI